MSDGPQRINLDEFRDRKPGPRKTRSKGGDPEHELTDADVFRDNAETVIDSDKLTNKSVEEIAELVIRRMANVVLLGGVLPTSLKETSDTAKVWASVASMEAARRAGKGSGQSEDDPVVRDALAQLTELQRKGGGK